MPAAQFVHDVYPTSLHFPTGHAVDNVVEHAFPAEHCVHVEVPVAME